MEDLTIYIEYFDPVDEKNYLVDPLEESYEPTVCQRRRTAYTVHLAGEPEVRQVLDLAASLTPEGARDNSEPIHAYGPIGLQGRGFDHTYPLTISGQAEVINLMDKLARETAQVE